MQKSNSPNSIAIWAITPGGIALATAMDSAIGDCELFFPKSNEIYNNSVTQFDSLASAMGLYFHEYKCHVFIMAVGIVVRLIAAYLKNKCVDPAVVVMDEKAQHVISLLSGHIGGANRLAVFISDITGATPVITTATDVNHVPAIDVLAKDLNLYIENPEAIKWVNMALIIGAPIYLHDPYSILNHCLGNHALLINETGCQQSSCCIWVDDQYITQSDHPKTLILRPKTLCCGIGCNRGTQLDELKQVLLDVFHKHSLSVQSIRGLASIDIKSDEMGLLSLAHDVLTPIYFFSKSELSSVRNIQTPSAIVKKCIGVASVCEAASLLASGNGNLIVPKQTSGNVTIAVSRINLSKQNEK
ncbi:MAG: cobalt-precorrin 5A hydrolase [Desulfobacterales bacterium]|nr:cobalt-precorrin 5A hydrolase [Desulfobacterales bacterium]